VNKYFRALPIGVFVAGVLLFSGCHRSLVAQKRYPFTGRVVSVDSLAESAIIDGDAIPGFMDAMAMPYKITPAEMLGHLTAGDSISAEVVVVPAKGDDAAAEYWLENVKVVGHHEPSHAGAENSMHLPAPGEEVPDFAFTNQAGKRIFMKQYRGKVLLVTFIYTRCPFPDYCPRVSSNFAEIYREMTTNPALVGTHLLSVSFDPEHDTAKVLRDYGFSVAHTRDASLFNRWEFAAPAAADLPTIAKFFALTIATEGGAITHSLSTAVIGRDGKIVKWYHGSDWQSSDLIKDVSEAGVGKS
jgi:protein SCO1/2